MRESYLNVLVTDGVLNVCAVELADESMQAFYLQNSSHHFPPRRTFSANFSVSSFRQAVPC